MTEIADPAVTLQRLRASIDNIDAALIFMLAERFRCTQQVGVLKAEHGMPASDPNREREQISRLRSLALDAELDPEFAHKWFTFVVSEVIRHHNTAAESAGSDAAGAAESAGPDAAGPGASAGSDAGDARGPQES